MKQGYQYINEINKAETNIQMITGMSRDTVKGITEDFRNLSGELYTTSSQTMSAAQEYLRAGKTIEETRNLIKNTSIAGAISGQDSKVVADQLIAISNGFKISTENGQELMGVIDKLSAVDNASATSLI